MARGTWNSHRQALPLRRRLQPLLPLLHLQRHSLLLSRSRPKRSRPAVCRRTTPTRSQKQLLRLRNNCFSEGSAAGRSLNSKKSLPELGRLFLLLDVGAPAAAGGRLFSPRENLPLDLAAHRIPS